MDEPLLCFENRLIGAPYAVLDGDDSPIYPMSDAVTRDLLRPAIPRTDANGRIAIEYAVAAACDTLVIGAHRHKAGGYRFAGGRVGVQYAGVPRTNIAYPSEDISTAPWSIGGATVNINVADTPTGNTTMDELVESAVLASHNAWLVRALPTIGLVATSCSAKLGVGNRYLQIRPTGIGSGVAFATFDLTTGQLVPGGYGGTAFVSAGSYYHAESGTYRCWLVGNYGTAPSGFQFMLGNSAGENPVYLGDGVSSIIIGCFQIEYGGAATDYIPALSQAVTSPWYNAIDSDGIADQPRLLNAAFNQSEGIKLKTHTPTAGGTWSKQTTTFAAARCIIFAGSNWVIGITDGILYSEDNGLTWTKVTITVGRAFQAIAFSGGIWVIVDNVGIVYSSYDLLTWTVRTATGLTSGNAIVWTGSQFVLVGAPTKCFTSPDGITWTSRTIANTHNDVAWDGALLVAVGAGGVIETSPDGITWTARTSGTANNLNAVGWADSAWVAVGDSGTIIFSFDAITWYPATSGTANALYDIETAEGEGYTRVCGASGTVLESLDSGLTWTDISYGATTQYAIGTNDVTWLSVEDANDIWRQPDAYLYRITFAGLPVLSDAIVPEIYLGTAMVMPFVELGWDPYHEVSGVKSFETEKGRIHEQLFYRRLELDPQWQYLVQAEWTQVEEFREVALERRVPFWLLWKPDSAPTECYLMRNRPPSAKMPYQTQAHRSFGLNLVEDI